ncbi:MAG: hypothetical protein Q7S05_04015 [bacterium]|nr:hypothetical protein [bacterium]
MTKILESPGLTFTTSEEDGVAQLVPVQGKDEKPVPTPSWERRETLRMEGERAARGIQGGGSPHRAVTAATDRLQFIRSSEDWSK